MPAFLVQSILKHAEAINIEPFEIPKPKLSVKLSNVSMSLDMITFENLKDNYGFGISKGSMLMASACLRILCTRNAGIYVCWQTIKA